MMVMMMVMMMMMEWLDLGFWIRYGTTKIYQNKGIIMVEI